MKMILNKLTRCMLVLTMALQAGQVFSQTVHDTPIMGWSSWNTYHVNISDSLIMRQADALVNLGLKDVGYTYINVDDGFFGYRDTDGKMHAHPQRFPNGMKLVADYIHALGLKAGIYAEAGDNTCGSIYDNDANGVGAGLYGHEQQDMDLYLKDWGYDFIKIDYCGGRDLGLDEEQRYRAICDAIAATGRDDVSINICRWAFPGTWARELARSWRISPDIRPRWSSLKNIIENNLYLSAYAGGGHYNDMDMLEIGRGLTPDEEQLHFGMWCIMSSPLLIGCDLNSLSDKSLKLLKNKELIALNQDHLGLQAYVAERDSDCYVLVKDIERLYGTKRAMALLNMSENEYRFSVDFKDLELGGDVAVRDVINGIDITSKGAKSTIQNFEYAVAPHSVLICVLEGEVRLEPTRYEAEWSYLNNYEDVGRHKKPVYYATNPECSGTKYVKQLGGSIDNYAQWSNVYSKTGGVYDMTIHYLADKDRKLDVYVNGEKYTVDAPAAATVSQVSLTVPLIQGVNEVRMGNSYTWAPDIDCFTLTKTDKPAHKYKGNHRVAVSLTFDDGLLEHYTEVFPRLQELGVKATFWLCGEKIEAGNFKGTPTMTWEMAREMANAGMEMSNHGWSHTSIDKLDDKGIIHEAERNDSVILVNTGIRPATFCYPFNKHNAHSDSLLSVGRIGLRTQQVSLGGKQYEKQGGNLIALYEKAKANGEWLVTMTHGITTGYDNLGADADALWDFIKYIASDDDCWIATFAEVKEYLYQSEIQNIATD